MSTTYLETAIQALSGDSESSRADAGGSLLISTHSSSLLDKVPETFLKRLSCQKGNPTLDLSLCVLKKVPLDAIELYYGEVDSLDLSYNHFRSLPAKFPLKLNTVTILNLKHNELRRLPDNFGELDNLIDLNISENQLETLPLSMGKLKKLERLDLSGNPFQSPLCNFLDAEKIRLNHEDADLTKVASSVVGLLAKLSQDMFPSYGEYFTTSSQRGVSFEGDETPSGLNGALRRRDTDHEHYKLTRRNAEMSLSETDEKSSGWNPYFWRTLGLVGFMASFGLLPFILAFFYSTSFLEHMTGSNAYLEYIWTMYKPYHTTAENTLISAKILNRPFYYWTSYLPESWNVFQTVYHYLVDSFTYMIQLIT